MCLAQEPRGLEETSSPDPLPPRLPPCSGGGGQLGLNVAPDLGGRALLF